MAKKFLRLPTVIDRTGLSASTIWARVAEGVFPEPIKLGAQAVGWIESKLDEWMEKLIEVSRGKNARNDAPTRDPRT